MRWISLPPLRFEWTPRFGALQNVGGGSPLPPRAPRPPRRNGELEEGKPAEGAKVLGALICCVASGRYLPVWVSLVWARWWLVPVLRGPWGASRA